MRVGLALRMHWELGNKSVPANVLGWVKEEETKRRKEVVGRKEGRKGKSLTSLLELLDLIYDTLVPEDRTQWIRLVPLRFNAKIYTGVSPFERSACKFDPSDPLLYSGIKTDKQNKPLAT